MGASGRCTRRSRWLVGLVTGTLVLSLAGCGGSDSASVSSTQPSTGASTSAVRSPVVGAELARWRATLQTLTAPRYPDGEQHVSVRFVPGTSYAEALTAIFTAIYRVAPLPGSAVVSEALPEGVVVRWPSGETTGAIEVDLQAPFGWHPSRDRANLPTLTLPPDAIPPETAPTVPRTVPWPPGAYLDVPILPDCQMLLGSRSAAPCGPRDQIRIDFDRLRGPPLDTR